MEIADFAEEAEKRMNKQKEVLSPLMRARMPKGGKPNFCPFGCGQRHLDDKGYCLHLVGFTQDTPEVCKSGKGKLEPMLKTRFGRRVVVEREKIYTGEFDENEDQLWEWGDPKLEPVHPDDTLVRITSSYRVYRAGTEQRTLKEPPRPKKKEETVAEKLLELLSKLP